MRFIIALLIVIQSSLYGVDFTSLSQALTPANQKHPFHYPLSIEATQGSSRDESVMIAFHGYGSDYKVGKVLHSLPEISDHLVSFNFPDYHIRQNTRDPNKTSFGSIQELLPALYTIKKCVIDCGMDHVNLYGFSAGGGALVNTIAVLNTDRFNAPLAQIGITPKDKQVMLKAIQKGHIILDCSLKSIDEIIAFRGNGRELNTLGKRFVNNDLRPIDSIRHFKNLSLNILVHFQLGDRSLSNRDDALFIERLQTYNCNGNTCGVIGNDGGHLAYHAALWKIYPEFLAGKHRNTTVRFE